jgi:arylsulfatase A-like enzyme
MTQQRPNIILIITDQQRYDTVGALGFDYMETPTLDRLVSEGTAFDNCFITAPSCAPSRASLFTGYYPHVTGILKNKDRWTHSWVEDLAAAGYHCVNIGKMHTYPWETPLGFHERYVVENKDRYLEGRYYFDEWDKGLRARGLVKQQRTQYRQRSDYRERMGAFEWELPPDTQSDVFVGEMATWWLHTYPQSQPLFLQIGFPGPHPPYDPLPDAAARYMAKDLPIQPVSQVDLDGQPPAFQQLRQHNIEIDHDSVVHLAEPTAEQRHRQRAYYLANVSMIDEQVDAVLAALDEAGYLENSIVIFTSDHGDCLGDHGHIQKWTMYDSVVRVPLLLWGQGIPAGRRISNLCQLMDVGATVLDLAGVERPETMQAVSLAPALADADWPGRDWVFAEHVPDGIYEGPYMSMIRGDRWKLVHFLNSEAGQLFDLHTDPLEEHNLWDDPQFGSIKSDLLLRLLNWRIASGQQTASYAEGWR